jgi:hypothetical protein
VPTNQPAADLSDYADLIAYAAGTGQTPGAASGDLPPGYLPLPANLQAKAAAVVSELQADARASASPSPTSSATAPGTTPGIPSATPSGQAAASPTGTDSPGINPPHAELAAAKTEGQPLGAIRWVLLAVVIAGAACAFGGTVLRSADVARWLRRMRP